MKILVVGFGSMGRRRIRLVKDIDKEAEIMCVDSNKERMAQAQDAGFQVFESLSEGIDAKPDVAFVCTSPGHHHEIIIELLKAGIHVFTELNLVSNGYDEILACAQENNTKVFMSSTLLYKRQMELIDEIVKKQSGPVSYIYHVGQYLPDWHPWESYKNFFVGKKETNAVREILAIQLPWIVNTFGNISEVQSTRNKLTDLEVDYPDVIVSGITHENGNNGVFVADVVSRRAVTRLEVIGENVHIIWDGHNDDFYRFNLDSSQMEQVNVYPGDEHVEGYSDNIAEQPYREEIKDFLRMVKEGTTPRYSLEKDRYILSVIDRIEGIAI